MSGIVVRPGDTVLMRFDSHVSQENVEEITEKLKSKLPGCDVVFLSGLQSIDVYRPDPAVADE